MALVYVCCFWFSLRLGSVLCATFSALKYICLLVFILSKKGEFEGEIEKFFSDIEYNKYISSFIVENFTILFATISILFALYISICLIMFFGALLCKPKLCYPFLFAQIIKIFLGLFFYTILFKYLMYLASRASVDLEFRTSFSLGEVILYLTLGLFYIYFEIYLTICVSSFTEIIEDLQRQIKKHKQENNIFIYQ